MVYVFIVIIAYASICPFVLARALPVLGQKGLNFVRTTWPSRAKARFGNRLITKCGTKTAGKQGGMSY